MSFPVRSIARVCPLQRQFRSSALALTRSHPRLALWFISLQRTSSLNHSKTLDCAASVRRSFSTTSSSSSSSSSSSLSSSPIVCPECSTEAPSDSRYSFFCPECLSILPVDRTKTYFQVLNTPATYDVDPRALVIYKRHLMKQLHPDKFVREEPEVMKMAEDQSALVNEASAVLSNPYHRGVYLLRLNGVEIEEGTNPKLDQEFLLELMELNEEAEAIKDAEEAEKMMKRIQRVVANMERDLSEAFIGGSYADSTFADTPYRTADSDEAKVILEKIKFFLNLEDILREKMTGF